MFHLLPALDACHPAVSRFLARLELAPFPVGILETFKRIPYVPEEGPDESGMSTKNLNLHSPLTYAVSVGNRLVAEWLLTVGADPNCHYIEPGLDLEPFARFGPCPDLEPYSEPYPSPTSWPIMYAATCKDTSMLRLLLERGANVHVSRIPSSSRWGVGGPEIYHRVLKRMTPLHLAGYHRRYDNVRLLIFHGADFRRECDLVDPTNRGRLVGFNASGTARDAAVMGSIAERLSKTSDIHRSYELDEDAVSSVLEGYDSALQAGLEERRAFVLCCLRKSGNVKSIPGHLIAKIFHLAALD